MIVRAMICACFKHPLHRTAILRRTCLGCSCASSVVTECFDSALLPPALACCAAHVVPIADLVPRLWSRLTTPFQMAFIDLLHDCCKMGLGDLPRMGISVVAALVVQATSDSPASPSLTRLLTVLRSPDFSSSHATPALATALLHAAICFRSEPPVAAACADAAAAIVDVCCRSEGGGAGVALAFRDGSAVALAWCALHIFVDTVTAKAGRTPPASDASVACNAVWSQLHDAGVVAAQAAALCAVVHRVEVGSPPLLITQRLNRVLDALPLQPCDDAPAQPDADAACVIPWPIQHHLSWMLQVPVESELLLQQLVHVWISRSSFRPLWVLQCAVQSPGDPCRYSPPPRCCPPFHALDLQAVVHRSHAAAAHQMRVASGGGSLRLLRFVVPRHGRRLSSRRKLQRARFLPRHDRRLWWFWWLWWCRWCWR